MVKAYYTALVFLLMACATPGAHAMSSLLSFLGSAPKTEAEKILGYNPKIVIEKPYDENRHGEIPVVCLHGFGGCGSNYQGWSETWARPVVYFDFEDVESTTAINLGQKPDAQTVLYVLGFLRKNQYKKVHLWGLSRGGACAIQLLHILQNPEKYKDLFVAMSIDTTLRTALKDMVINDTSKVVLAHPLLSVPSATKQIAKNIVRNTSSTSMHDTYLEETSLRSTSLFSQVGLAVATKYKFFAQTPIEMLRELLGSKNNTINLAVAFVQQGKDQIVGDEYNQEVEQLIKQYAQKNKKSEMLVGGYHHNDITGIIYQAYDVYDGQ